MKFCVKCGKQLSQDSNFCPGCGTPALNQSEQMPSGFSSETKVLGPKECLHEKAVQQEAVDRIFCSGCNSFVNMGTWEAEPYEGHKFERCNHLRIAPGIRGPHREPMCSECGVLLKRDISLKEDKRPLMVEETGKPKWPLWVAAAALLLIVILSVNHSSSVGNTSSSSGASTSSNTGSKGHWAQNCITVWVPNPNYDPNWQTDSTGGQGGTSSTTIPQQQCAQTYVTNP